MAGHRSSSTLDSPTRSRPSPAARRGAHSAPARPQAPRAAARPRGVAYPHRRSPEQLARFAQLLAEVLAGERPARQVRPLLSRRAYELLARRAGAYAGASRPRLMRTVLRTPAPDVAEISAVLDCGPRCRALALRVAYAQHAWLCTHIETDLCRAAVR
ncbi:Rv3235 family protein [Streptomonospora litoralis]|uniref:Uncharacterized protein n=1 Tax=Streptomonospora litoralis TaxID=2498135 RepID=A0A4P6Q231_9ACTN|nr:Rv3235 family protein [Streptomonospora litoralis]QBI54190.1 hypothetical protein EKD16_12035 [Streptomonospora litoralis]